MYKCFKKIGAACVYKAEHSMGNLINKLKMKAEFFQTELEKPRFFNYYCSIILPVKFWLTWNLCRKLQSFF